ncbi:hypothetical protein Hbl1158_03755 [Halobaculum sp. CBA1158]|uniref:DUF7095 family protein n=1 Tax=Halobaculum sp. CBA1158 TaxID=2904243 RepID=UPI001F46DB74|nr:hypothetical protein [Halobaculum sp. CBA1158]UIP00489.1 hypothetical protein Hbl1158_03755 [Halobaculum sp. CBA1158]
MEREAALDRVEAIIDAVDEGPTPVPVREVWVYGDVALGLDPIDRLDVYVTKDLLMRGDDADAAESFERSHGVKGVGRSVSAEWAREHPEHLRANDAGHAAPEKCLAAQLLPEDEPVHLEVCNAPFDQNVRQRLTAGLDREAYEQVLDPRGVQLYAEGRRATETMAKLRGGELPFPTLSGALEMLGVEDAEATAIADAMATARDRQEGATVRGDVV